MSETAETSRPIKIHYAYDTLQFIGFRIMTFIGIMSLSADCSDTDFLLVRKSLFSRT